jgi:protein O-GlcNAc transferase
MVYMPHTYYPVGNRATSQRDHAEETAGPPPQRFTYGLPQRQQRGGVVYGAFNDHYKIDPAIFRAWMAILKREANVTMGASGECSVLWGLKHGGEQGLLKAAAKARVRPAALVFSDFFPKTQHLRIKGLSDLFLDTPLYNAHSTASDMLWAQVPVLTLPQEKMAARAAASIIMAAGLGVGVARNDADYREVRALHSWQHVRHGATWVLNAMFAIASWRRA